MMHVEWDILVPSDDATVRGIQLAYTEGYLLALDDVRKILDELQSGWKGQSFSPYRMALQSVRAESTGLFDQAMATFELLSDSPSDENFAGEGSNKAS